VWPVAITVVSITAVGRHMSQANWPSQCDHRVLRHHLTLRRSFNYSAAVVSTAL
jgi:hypothetical protein